MKRLQRIILSSVLLPVLYPAAPQAFAAEEIVRTALRVKNITCTVWLARIDNELQNLDGMIRMSADPNQGLVTVEHARTLDSKTISATITALGYPASVIASQKIQDAGAAAEAQSSPAAVGCGGAGACPTGASTWKQLLRRYFGKKAEPAKAVQQYKGGADDAKELDKSDG